MSAGSVIIRTLTLPYVRNARLVALAWDADTSRKFITSVLADIRAHQPNTLIATGSGE
jgi:hypothetical protein